MSLVYSFRNEIEQVQDDKMRDFLVESLDCVPEYYFEMKEYSERTKRAFKYTMVMVEEMDSTDIAHDILAVACLLQDVTMYVNGEDGITENVTHPLSVRTTLAPFQTIIGRDLFDNTMRVIEGSHGFMSPIPQVEPDFDSPAQMWILPFANALAKEVA
jgi:hypothetical protein